MTHFPYHLDLFPKSNTNLSSNKVVTPTLLGFNPTSSSSSLTYSSPLEPYSSKTKLPQSLELPNPTNVSTNSEEAPTS